jgi:hypothetical protein
LAFDAESKFNQSHVDQGEGNTILIFGDSVVGALAFGEANAEGWSASDRGDLGILPFLLLCLLR